MFVLYEMKKVGDREKGHSMGSYPDHIYRNMKDSHISFKDGPQNLEGETPFQQYLSVTRKIVPCPDFIYLYLFTYLDRATALPNHPTRNICGGCLPLVTTIRCVGRGQQVS